MTGLTLEQLAADSAPAYRAYDFMTRSQGLVLVAFGSVTTAILLIPYRGGRRWAWWASWSLPAWAFAVLGLYAIYGTAPNVPPPPPMISGPILGIIAVIVLLLDRARFGAPPAAASPVAAVA